MRLTSDSGTRLVAGGSVLVGGSPVRVLRLTPAGARQVAGWFAGEPVPPGAGARALARRLLDAGIAHPDFAAPGGLPDDAGTDAARPGGGDPAEAAAPRSPAAADVTVVIPVRDRHAELARCLSGLRGLPHVIVVDDASADPLAIKRIAAGNGAAVIHRPVNGGPGAARNTGLAAAQTELVAFLDSDCVPRPGWLEGLLPHFTDPAAGAVAPRIVPHQEGTGWLARYEGASSTLDMGARPSIVRPGARVSYVPGAALVVRRAAAGDGFRERHVRGGGRRLRVAHVGGRLAGPLRAGRGHGPRPPGQVPRLVRPPRRLRHLRRRPRATAPWLGPPAVRLLVDGRRVDGGALRPPGHRGGAHRDGDRPARPPPVPRHRRTLAAADPADAGGHPSSLDADGSSTLAATPASDNSSKRSQLAGSRGSAAWRLAIALAGGGTIAAARPLGSAISRTWWPVAIPAALAVKKLRLPVAALILAPPLLDWADRRPPLDPARYVAARLLDDAAYSLGVWQGCLARRTVRPLLPVIGGKRPAPLNPRYRLPATGRHRPARLGRCRGG